jgi:AraC-like DNA-binding protein
MNYPETVKAIHDLVIGNIRIDWKIRELCEGFCIGYTAFNRHFKHMYGKTPNSYFRRKQFIQIRKTLLTTNRSIRSVIGDYGIKSYQGFSRQYKRIFGETMGVTLKETRHRNGRIK